MTEVNMKPMDLIELYQLANLYKRVYHPGEDATIQEMIDKISERYANRTKGQNIAEARNPRGAGREKVHTHEEDQRILYLRAQGKTMRAISAESGCSLSYVQHVISQSKNRGNVS